MVVATALLSAGELLAERVGYSFTGTLTGTSTISLYGYNVPRPSPISGTFSYDTTASCVDCDPSDGVRTFHQSIQGGYTLNINNGQVQLSANDYLITVYNDFGAGQNDQFSIDYNYDSAGNPPVTPAPILEHGNPWSGPTKTRAFIKLQLNWPGTKFTDPDEPKLTGDRPTTSDASICATCAFVGSSGSTRLLAVSPSSILAIAPTAGDYNYDGKYDDSDYIEWRKLFGGSQPPWADNNGAVDLSDYLPWRKAQSASASGATFANTIPEPTSLLLFVVGLSLIVTGQRRAQK